MYTEWIVVCQKAPSAVATATLARDQLTESQEKHDGRGHARRSQPGQAAAVGADHEQVL
jgi:hypothetical protein